MAVKVNVYGRKVMGGPDEGTVKYYGRTKSGEMIPFDRLCEKISHFSSATKGDVLLVLNGFIDLMEEYLQAGFIVQLAGLGNFRVTCGSCGTHTEDAFHVSCMKRPSYVFTPGVTLKAAMEDVRFERMDVKVVEVEDCTLPH